jgi:hypothetical protein
VASRRGPDNSVRVALVATMRGQNVANIFHAQLTTSSTIAQADLDTWLSTFAGDYKTRFQGLLPTDYTFSYAKAVLYAPGGGELVSTYTPTAWSGTGASGSAIGALCAVISWQSGVYWRGGKPRTYVPLPSNQVSSGLDTVAATFRTNLTTDGTNFKNDINGLSSGTITGTTFGFVSFRSGNAERGTPLFFAIVGCVVHARVGTQRRRNGKWQN